mmetsp:Transcript_12365/g.43301  ORF Transcript_12365/g.43301 Transcript_12365/m.43301 type:complete len:215 (-) Transcript_12365:5-649(-)
MTRLQSSRFICSDACRPRSCCSISRTLARSAADSSRIVCADFSSSLFSPCVAVMLASTAARSDPASFAASTTSVLSARMRLSSSLASSTRARSDAVRFSATCSSCSRYLRSLSQFSSSCWYTSSAARNDTCSPPTAVTPVTSKPADCRIAAGASPAPAGHDGFGRLLRLTATSAATSTVAARRAICAMLPVPVPRKPRGSGAPSGGGRRSRTRL